MALVSVAIGAGVAATHTQVNNLRTDIVTHVHDSDVSDIDHTDLLQAGTKTHNQIDVHIAASGGVHVGGATSSVLLSHDTQKAMRTGPGSVQTFDPGWYTATLTFAKPFNSIPAVIIMQKDTTLRMSSSITACSAAGFTVSIYNKEEKDLIPWDGESDPPSSTGRKLRFYWWAVGT